MFIEEVESKARAEKPRISAFLERDSRKSHRRRKKNEKKKIRRVARKRLEACPSSVRPDDGQTALTHYFFVWTDETRRRVMMVAYTS
jgi:hypothetical protein